MVHPAQVHRRIVGNLAGNSIALIDRIRGIQQRTTNKGEKLFVCDGPAVCQLAVRRFANANRREGIRQFRRPQLFQQTRVGKDSIDEWRIARHEFDFVRTRPLHAREFTDVGYLAFGFASPGTITKIISGPFQVVSVTVFQESEEVVSFLGCSGRWLPPSQYLCR